MNNGGPIVYANGGEWANVTGYPQGFDGINLPKSKKVIWTRGSKVEVAWGIHANHGGGYTYRLCKAKEASEECF